MKPRPERVEEWLRHILEAIGWIEVYVAGMCREQFLGTRIAQDAVIRNLEIIGEASRNIDRADPGFAAAHPKFPLRSAVEFRNLPTRGGFAVDHEIVWRTVVDDLPTLRSEIERILAARPAGMSPGDARA